MISRFELLGVHISILHPDLAIQTLLEWVKEKKKAYVCVAPVSTIVDCQKQSAYKEIINQADMVTPDGMPVVWMGKLKGHTTIARTYGPDLMRRMCDEGQKEHIKHFFYGGNDETNRILIQKLKDKFPDIHIAGAYAPGQLKLNSLEDQSVIDQMNQSQADILWVGLGSPKQDYWMKNHRDQLNVPVIVGVGAAFDFIAGVKSQAPKWMQKSGLEWLFRLVQEPQRLWRRYLLGNSLFMYLIIKDILRGWVKPHD